MKRTIGVLMAAAVICLVIWAVSARSAEIAGAGNLPGILVDNIDSTGVLSVGWTAPEPTFGYELAHYQWELFVNADTTGLPHKSELAGSSITAIYAFDTLMVEGDYAYFRIRAVATPDNPDTSVWAVSERAIYDDPSTGLNPPVGVQWIGDGRLLSRQTLAPGQR